MSETMPNKRLCALITGASSGIGEATALAFAQAGIDLILIARRAEPLESVAERARAHGAAVTTSLLDLADVAQVQAGVAALVQQVEGLDILVNNAGMGYTGQLADMSLADWQRVFDLNVTSVLQCVQAVLPAMRSRGQGTIINVSSVAGQQVFPEWGAYCASKFALMALSRTLGMEERAYGIRVTTISPGSVNTPLWDTDTVHADFDRSAMLTPELVAQSILHTVLLPPQAVVENLVLMPNAGTF